MSQVISALSISYPHLLDLVRSRNNSVAMAEDDDASQEYSVLVVAGVLMLLLEPRTGPRFRSVVHFKSPVDVTSFDLIV